MCVCFFSFESHYKYVIKLRLIVIQVDRIPFEFWTFSEYFLLINYYILISYRCEFFFLLSLLLWLLLHTLLFST